MVFIDSYRLGSEFFRDWLEGEVARARRHKHCFSLVVFDIDEFRIFDKSQKYIYTKACFEKMCKILREGVRLSDIVFVSGFRKTGFVVILPETDKKGAVVFANRVKNEMERFSNTLWGVLPKEERPTVSAGISSFPDDGESDEVLCKKAEQAFNDARKRGGNMVVSVSDINGPREE
ncbi:MAG: GGDEF domain-containing protein [bacterium]|nr:GGDEF domain-containing protein [bacterium]